MYMLSYKGLTIIEQCDVITVVGKSLSWYNVQIIVCLHENS